MKRVILFTFCVWISNSFSLAAANVPKESCIVSPEDTRASILGILEYKKDSYAQYEESLLEQIRSLKLDLSKKNIEVEFSPSECLEDALLNLNNLSDLINQELSLGFEKSKSIILGANSDDTKEDTLYVKAITPETSKLVVSFLKK